MRTLLCLNKGLAKLFHISWVFLLKFLLRSYEKASWPACRDPAYRDEVRNEFWILPFNLTLFTLALYVGTV